MTDSPVRPLLSREDLLACALAIPPPDPDPYEYSELSQMERMAEEPYFDLDHDPEDIAYERYEKYAGKYCDRVAEMFWAGSGGSEHGWDAFVRWLMRSDNKMCFAENSWERLIKSPPTGLTAQSLIDFATEGQRGFAQKLQLPSDESGVVAGALDLVDVETLLATEPNKRDFIIEDMAAAGTVVMLIGKPGLGKTQLAMQAGESLRRGTKFLGRSVTPCTALIYSCEDDHDELHRRHARMQRGLGHVSNCPGKLLFASRVGADNALAVYDSKSGKVVPTASYHALHAQVLETGARFVVIDTVAQTFTGSENDRGQVTGYVNLLTRLAQETNGAVLLISHPPKSEAEYSGSTGWDGTVRSRLFLHEIEKDGRRRQFLKLAKANYAQRFEIEISADDHGVWHLAGAQREGRAGEEEARRLAEGKTIFLDALDKLTAQGRAVSDSPRATNYAPKLIIQAGLGQQHSVVELRQAMETLFAAGEITANGVFGRRPNRTTIKGIVRVIPEPGESQQDSPRAEHDVDAPVEEVVGATG